MQELAQELIPIITHLFKQSLDINELPLEWKSAYVTPIFMKDKKSDPSNCRPVSLTYILCEAFDHILVNQIIIINHIEDCVPTSLDSEQNSQPQTVLNILFSKNYSRVEPIAIRYCAC